MSTQLVLLLQEIRRLRVLGETGLTGVTQMSLSSAHMGNPYCWVSR